MSGYPYDDTPTPAVVFLILGLVLGGFVGFCIGAGLAGEHFDAPRVAMVDCLADDGTCAECWQQASEGRR